jgi:hypothetical protein
MFDAPASKQIDSWVAAGLDAAEWLHPCKYVLAQFPPEQAHGEHIAGGCNPDRQTHHCKHTVQRGERHTYRLFNAPNTACHADALPQASSGRIFTISSYEYTLPSGHYISELHQDKATGQLSPLSTRPVDWSSWGGILTPCAGDQSPWNSHMAGEEVCPDGKR